MFVTVATAQYPIIYHKNFADWQTHIEMWVRQAALKKAQILLFPEYGSMELVSLFDKSIQQDIILQIQALDGLKADFCTVFEQLAIKYQVHIIAPSLPNTEGGQILNRAYVFSPKGLMGYQDKFFMTRFEHEEWGIKSPISKKLSLFEADWGKFGIQICYDIEFPIGSQLLNEQGATIIFAPSCTETIRGATRVHVGARARALENQCYTVVAQTVGNAAWSPAVDINYGYGAIYSTPDKNLPEKGIIAQKKAQNEGWLVKKLDLSLLQNVRQDGQVFNFKDMQKYNSWDIEILRYF